MRSSLSQYLKAACAFSQIPTPSLRSTLDAALFSLGGTQLTFPNIPNTAVSFSTAACATEVKLLKALKVRLYLMIHTENHDCWTSHLQLRHCVHAQRLEVTFTSGERFQYPAELLRVLSPSADSTVRVSCKHRKSLITCSFTIRAMSCTLKKERQISMQLHP